METSSRTGPTFLEKMAPGMAARTQREKEVASGKTKHTDGRGGSTHLVRYTAGKLAYGKSRGGIFGRRRTGACCQSPGRAGHLDTTNFEVMSIGRRDLMKRTFVRINLFILRLICKLSKEQLTILAYIQERNLSFIY